MRHLVGDELAARAGRAEAVEDARRELHAAADAVRLHLREFFVRVRPDAIDEELEHRLGVRGERLEARLVLLRKHPGRQRDASIAAEVVHRERRHGERHQPRARSARIPSRPCAARSPGRSVSSIIRPFDTT